MSLSETFVSLLTPGDNFLIGSTATGDIYYIDDYLNSAQLNTVPIESVGISGQKILGISSNKQIYEWSSSSLTKLSINKENITLLRQDFSMKEF